MALVRSASGPSGLSINTASANSLFGSNTPTSGGMFGNTQSSKPAGGIFGATTATSAPQSGALFGSTTTSQPATGGLFANTITSQPTQSGGLFAAPSTTAQPQQTGGMFSGVGGQQNQQQTGGGLFGASATQSTQSGGMFGGLSQNQNKLASTLFGAQPQQQSANQQGGLSLGHSTNQQQTVPGVRIDIGSIRSTTRYNDLHEDLQKEIQTIDNVIQLQMKLKDDCEAIMPAHSSQLAHVPNDVEYCQRKLIAVERAADEDVQSIAVVQKLNRTDTAHLTLSTKSIDNLNLPSQYHNPNAWSSQADNRGPGKGGADGQDIIGFFSTTANELAATLSNYQRHILEIEHHLRGVEANSAQQVNQLVARRNGSTIGQDEPMEQLGGALRDFEESLLGVAGKVGGAREGVQSLQLGRFTNPRNDRNNVNKAGIY